MGFADILWLFFMISALQPVLRQKMLEASRLRVMHRFERTRKIAAASAKGVVADVRHPGENPGYLFMDALGLVSAGAGTAATAAKPRVPPTDERHAPEEI